MDGISKPQILRHFESFYTLWSICFHFFISIDMLSDVHYILIIIFLSEYLAVERFIELKRYHPLNLCDSGPNKSSFKLYCSVYFNGFLVSLGNSGEMHRFVHSEFQKQYQRLHFGGKTREGKVNDGANTGDRMEN